QDLIVAEAGSTATAAGLGLLGNSGGTNVLSGSSLNRVTETSQLSTLNDRNGIGILGGGQADMRIGLDGQTFDVSLSGATNLGQVLDAINDHAGNTGVTASIAADGVSLQLEGAGEITVAAQNDSQAAADLGILGQAQNTLAGERLVAGLNSRLLSNVNGGSGITTFGSIDITNKAGTQTNVDLTQARSISEVIQTINDAGAGITASVDSTGKGFTLTDTSGGGGNLIISDVDGTVATDLKLATDPAGQAEATLNTGSLEYRYVGEGTQLTGLNGGQGVTEGRFTITDSAGVSATVTIDEGQKNLRDVILEINARSTAVVASINERGDGLLLTDTAGGPLAMSVEEAGSTTARELGIRGEAAEGEAFIDGTFATTIDVEAGDTLADVADKINAAGAFVTAGVLDDGSSDNSSRLTFASRRSGVAGQMV
ncbi:MAG: flagellin hook IN motif-containing protein, partial [Phycisphaeraceae bacterium]